MIFSVQTSDYSFVDYAIDVREVYKAPLLSSKKCLQKLHKVTGETVLGVFIMHRQVQFTQNRL